MLLQKIVFLLTELVLYRRDFLLEHLVQIMPLSPFFLQLLTFPFIFLAESGPFLLQLFLFVLNYSFELLHLKFLVSQLFLHPLILCLLLLQLMHHFSVGSPSLIHLAPQFLLKVSFLLSQSVELIIFELDFHLQLNCLLFILVPGSIFKFVYLDSELIDVLLVDLLLLLEHRLHIL